MFKSYLTSGIAVLILSAGLPSCSPDKKAGEVFKAPPPRVVIGGQEFDFREIEKLSNKAVELSDQIDFSKGRPASVAIQAQCRHKNRDIRSERLFAGGQSLVKFLQIIPEELLAQDLSKEAALCAFEVSIKNTEGSQHVLSLISILVSENRTPQITIENKRIRWNNVAPAAAHILCSDIKLAPLNFEKVRDLDDFDFTKYELYEGRDREVIESRRQQSCRVVISENGKIEALSAPFSKLLPGKEFEYRITVAPKHIEHAKLFRLATIVIANRGSATRWLTVSPQALTANFETYFHDGPQKRYDFFPTRSLRIKLLAPRLKSVEKIQLAPNAEITLVADVDPRYPTGCEKNSAAAGLRVILQTPTLSEVDEAGQVLENLPINKLPRFVQLSGVPWPEVETLDPKPTKLCKWN